MDNVGHHNHFNLYGIMNKIIHPFFVVLILAFIIILTAMISAIEIPMAKKKIMDSEIYDHVGYSKFIDSLNHNQQ